MSDSQLQVQSTAGGVVHLVYIHGWRGDHTSFQRFPTDLHNYILSTAAIPNLKTHIYPTYKAEKPLNVATANFLAWMGTLESGRVIVAGHSMGGLLAAEAALYPPTAKHKIIGVLAFDTPLLGIHPHVIFSGIASLFRKDAATEEEMNDAKKVNIIDIPELSASLPGAAALNSSLPPHPASPPAAKPSFLTSTLTSGYNFLRAHSADPLGYAKRWLVEQVEFPGAMVDPSGLTARYQKLEAWGNTGGGNWVNLFTITVPEGGTKPVDHTPSGMGVDVDSHGNVQGARPVGHAGPEGELHAMPQPLLTSPALSGGTGSPPAFPEPETRAIGGVNTGAGSPPSLPPRPASFSTPGNSAADISNRGPPPSLPPRPSLGGALNTSSSATGNEASRKSNYGDDFDQMVRGTGTLNVNEAPSLQGQAQDQSREKERASSPAPEGKHHSKFSFRGMFHHGHSTPPSSPPLPQSSASSQALRSPGSPQGSVSTHASVHEHEEERSRSSTPTPALEDESKSKKKTKSKSPQHFIVLPWFLSPHWVMVPVEKAHDEVAAHCGLFFRDQNLEYDAFVAKVGDIVLKWCNN